MLSRDERHEIEDKIAELKAKLDDHYYEEFFSDEKRRKKNILVNTTKRVIIYIQYERNVIELCVK